MVGKRMKRQREVEEENRRNEMEISPWSKLASFPNEIKDQIFERLPTNSVMRFRCVLKDYIRFHNPHFMKIHLNRQIGYDNGSSVIVKTASKIYKVDFDNFSSPNELNFPFRHPTCKSPIVVVGSCNGLLLLTHRGMYGEIMYLWNPATGDHKQLPAHVDDGCTYIRTLGFGYDCSSGKFKVVVISKNIHHHGDEAAVSVYTVGTNSWRSIGEVKYPTVELKPAKMFGGRPYWVLPRLKIIVSFNMENEKFEEIPMPPFGYTHFTNHANLSALGGVCLLLICKAYKPFRFELWLRVNDGPEKMTWERGLYLKESYLPGDLTRGGSQNVKVYGYKNGKILLQNNGPALFCPETQQVAGLRLPGDPNKFDVYSYIESLATVE